MKIKEVCTSWAIVNEENGAILGSVCGSLMLNAPDRYYFVANISTSGSGGGYASSKDEAIEGILKHFKQGEAND